MLHSDSDLSDADLSLSEADHDHRLLRRHCGAGVVNWTACAAGTFTARDNATACDNCTAGMYKADTGWPTIGIGIGIGSLESSWMASDSLDDDRWILFTKRLRAKT